MPGFDSHHPPSDELIDKCVHCGFCLPACPTYVLWREEMDSPRGRIFLMKTALEGTIDLNSGFVSHFDSCLGCMACMTACPSGVDYEKLIEATRAQIERRHRRPLLDRIYRRLLFSVLTRPGRLQILRLPLLAYQRTGVRSLVRSLGLDKLLPRRLRALEALAPEVGSSPPLPHVTPAQGTPRCRVGLLLGCVQRVFFPEVNHATVRVLSAEGCEVVVPDGQPCCGALPVHAGEEGPAISLARRTIDVFERAGVDVILTNAAGCGSHLKAYGHLLRDDPEYASRAVSFSSKCRDVCEFLAGLEPRATRHALPLRVAYQDACHLSHAQHIRAEPRSLLRTIPELSLLELPDASLCCGSAGIYNLVQPAPAEELGRMKADAVMQVAPDVVASGNPGCLLQMGAALRLKGHVVELRHTIELLDASFRNVSVLSGRG